MPYTVSRHAGCPKNKPWGVAKKTGQLIGCHRSQGSAKSQMRALYANEGKEAMSDAEVIEGTVELKEGESDEKCYDAPHWLPYGGATSFAEIDALMDAREEASKLEELNYQFRSLIGNVLGDDETEDKAAALESLVGEYKKRLGAQPKKKSMTEQVFGMMQSMFSTEKEDLYDVKVAFKRENGIDFPASDYAYVPELNNPKTWKLRMTESPGKISINALHRAASMLSTQGINGKRAGIPEAALSSVKRRVRAAYRKIGVQEIKIPQSVKSADAVPPAQADSPLYIWKNAKGEYNFVAIYSNNVRDDDYPPEILSQKAHRRFAEVTRKGLVPYPTLWHWHKRGTRWGQVQRIIEVDGFAIAHGTVDKGCETQAEKMMNLPYPIALSHGMPTRYIVRNPSDRSIIDFYISEEISTLPRSKAANKLTTFMLYTDTSQKERNAMPLSNDEVQYFRDVGLDEDAIASLNGLGEIGAKAEAAGRDRKEAKASPAEKAKKPPMPPEDDEDEDEDEDDEEDEGKKEAPVVVTMDHLKAMMDGLSKIVMPIAKAVNVLKERIDAMESEQGEVRAAQKQKDAERKEMTPAASVHALMASSFFGNNSEAIVKEGDELANAKPAEVPVPAFSPTGISFLDDVISRAYSEAE